MFAEDWTECPNFCQTQERCQVGRGSRGSILGTSGAFYAQDTSTNMSLGRLSIPVAGCQPLISRYRRCGVLDFSDFSSTFPRFRGRVPTRLPRGTSEPLFVSWEQPEGH